MGIRDKSTEIVAGLGIAALSFFGFNGATPLAGQSNNQIDAQATGTLLNNFIDQVGPMNSVQFKTAFDIFKQQNPALAAALLTEVQKDAMVSAPYLRVLYLKDDPNRHAKIQNILNAVQPQQVIYTNPSQNNAAGQNQGAAGGYAAVQLEPQAAFDKFFNTLKTTVVNETNPIARVDAAKYAGAELAEANPAVYDTLLSNAKIITRSQKLRSGELVGIYIEEMAIVANNTEIDKLEKQVIGMQQEITVARAEDMASLIGSTNAQAELFNKDISDIKRAKNQERMRNTGGAIIRTGANVAFNWAMGQAEDITVRSGGGGAAEAIRNMRYIFEDAARTREVGNARNDVYGEMANAWQQTLSITSEIQQVKAQQKIIKNVEAQLRDDFRAFCKKNKISETDMNTMIDKAITNAKTDLGIGAVDIKTQLEKHGLNPLQEARLEWQKAFEEFQSVKEIADAAGNSVNYSEVEELVNAQRSLSGAQDHLNSVYASANRKNEPANADAPQTTLPKGFAQPRTVADAVDAIADIGHIEGVDGKDGIYNYAFAQREAAESIQNQKTAAGHMKAEENRKAQKNNINQNTYNYSPKNGGRSFT